MTKMLFIDYCVIENTFFNVSRYFGFISIIHYYIILYNIMSGENAYISNINNEIKSISEVLKQTDNSDAIIK